MAKIPESYLPPPELRPKRIYSLDEFRNIPQKFNSTEVLLDQTAAKYGDKVAIYFDEQRITYKQLQASVNRVANGLKKLGVEEGDRVLMRMPNIPPIIVCNFAIIKIGAVSLPTSVLFSRSEIAHVANVSEAKVIIVAAVMLGELEAAKADLKFAKTIVVVGGDENEVRAKGYVPYADLMKNPDQCEAVKRDRMDVSVLLFTSGTTGLSQGDGPLHGRVADRRRRVRQILLGGVRQGRDRRPGAPRDGGGVLHRGGHPVPVRRGRLPHREVRPGRRCSRTSRTTRSRS